MNIVCLLFLFVCNLFKVTVRNFEVFMKQSHDSSDDHKFPVTANETLREKTAVFMKLLLMLVIGSESPQTQTMT